MVIFPSGVSISIIETSPPFTRVGNRADIEHSGPDHGGAANLTAFLVKEINEMDQHGAGIIAGYHIDTGQD
jgi:hypothetical protein